VSHFFQQSARFKRRTSDVFRFSRYLLPYWDKQLVLFICMGFSVLFSLAQPYFARVAIDHALLGRDLYLFNILLVVGIISYIFSVPIECIQKAAGFYLSIMVSLGLRSHFYRHMQFLSLRFAQSRPVGEHLYRLGADLDSVVQLIINTIPSALILICRFLLLLLICLWIDWRLTLILLAVSPFFYLHTWYFTKIQRRLSSMVITRSQNISSRLQQALSHTMLIKIFGRERNEFSRYISDNISLIRLNSKNLRVAILRGESGRLLNVFVTGGITYFLGYYVIKAKMTFGQLTAVSMYLLQFNGAIQSVGALYQDFVIRFIAMDRVMETLETEVEVQECKLPIRAWQRQGSLSLTDVSFGYNEGYPVLKSANLTLEPGQKVLLTGSVGSGKSTLCHLIMRLYDPLTGKIKLDGHDIRELKLDSLRKAIGFASSESMLFQDSVRNNISFGYPASVFDDVVQVARDVGIHDMILQLPQGYDTVLETGTVRLSQGQKQCVALARAIIKQPEILVLDEAFSGLDIALVETITTNLKRRHPEMTCLIVTHHIFDLKEVDRVIVIDDGALSEELKEST